MSKLQRWLLPLVFFGILLVPMLWFGHPGFAPGQLAENRKPQPFPSYSLLWFQKLERWFSDRFGLRDTLVYYGARLQVGGLGLSANRRVTLGRDGWLFFDESFKPGQPMFADWQGRVPLTEAQLERMTQTLRDTHQTLRACGIGFYFVMPADKQTIYPEKLPWRRTDGVATRADQLFAHLRRNAAEIPALDLRAPLLKAKAELPLELYMRTDTHWNSLGAFIGYRELARRLNADGMLPPTARTVLENYDFVPVPFAGGDIAVNMLSLADYFPDHKMQRQRGPEIHAGAFAHPAGWPQPKHPEEFLASANPHGQDTLLLYRDSFAEHLLPYLAEDFARIVAVFHHRIDGEEIRRAAPRTVVVEVLERLLEDLEKPPLNLNQACTR